MQAEKAGHLEKWHVQLTSDRVRKQRLAAPGRTVKQHAVGWLRAEVHKQLNVCKHDLNHFTHVLQCRLGTTEVTVSGRRSWCAEIRRFNRQL
jgi:hypothetical protein